MDAILRSMSEQTTDPVESKATRASARKRATKTAAKRSATVTSKRATTKRATTKRASTTRTRTASQSRTRTAAAKKEGKTAGDEVAASVMDGSESASTPTRRAPTNNMPPTTERPVVAFLRSLPISLYLTVTLSLVLLFGGVAVGVSDAGAISVREATEQYNQNIAERRERGEDVTEEVIPVQDSETRSSRPRFRPSVGGGNAEPSEETAGSATSTAATATSSEDGTSEEEELLDSMRENEEGEVDESVSDEAAEEDEATSDTEDGADDGVDNTDVSGDE